MAISKTPPHPLWTRLAHGLDLALLLLMASSGLQIYNANPVFGGREGATMPDLLLLGGWLAGGRQWHFAFMGVFALNLGLWIALLLWKRRRRLAESADLQALRTSRNEAKRRVSAHRLLYTLMLIVLSFGLITGLAMYKPASLWWLAGLFGSWQSLRALHFATVPAMAALIVSHSVISWRVGGLRLLRRMVA
jgi:thiosulfate reductase cytochrome b subunit